MKSLKCLLLSAFLLTPFLSVAEEAAERWKGQYRGVYSQVEANGETTSSQPFALDIGATGSGGFVSLNFSDGSEALAVTILNLHRRKENSPPVISEDLFYLPAIFADPTKFEAKVVRGGFDEELIEGTIVTYQLSVDGEPKEDMRIVFKAGRLR